MNPDREFKHIEGRFEQRTDLLSTLRSQKSWQIIIIGGGIHGAQFARLAAYNGLRTLLVEQNDYASETSSRSSKMAHGGLRYLENFDFQQVREGVKAREVLFKTASHLVTPADFLIPVAKGDHLTCLKLALGLSIYDFFVGNRHKHQWIPKEDLHYETFNSNSKDISGCFRYCDGIMNDSRLVIETIVSAREFGATCLNYMRCESVKQEKKSVVALNLSDMLTQEKFNVQAEVVVNCAGAWAAKIAERGKVRYSQGTHLLFNRTWNDPALFLPLNEKGRYYFVWPHFSGTLVGTTELEITAPESDPLPTKKEVDEILARLAIDVPHAGLDRNSLHYAFAGIRTLPYRKAGNSSTLSRKHLWSYANGMLTLLGGKFTTAHWTAFEGLKILCKLLKRNNDLQDLNNVNLPGAWETSAEKNNLLKRFKDSGLADVSAKMLVDRHGATAAEFLKREELLIPIGEHLFRGEIEKAVKIEQAETVADILSRRTGVEYLPGSGMEDVPKLCSELKRLRVDTAASQILEDAQRYINRVGKIKDLIK